ncbi:hypothetical protein O7632_03880 [Solwaraspora sp. WMMD406]|uniref:hypothetical protein n=1 Tax=Solwaraspora sp. WMMD406 TaxID=3016095 RepID=UPI002417D040|nr:hypothetical protein [Solwaraspora sp. WMMD406]MDG4763252.1 hypothetical protein [Solwaraspora sp. WMMD406]
MRNDDGIGNANGSRIVRNLAAARRGRLPIRNPGHYDTTAGVWRLARNVPPPRPASLVANRAVALVNQHMPVRATVECRSCGTPAFCERFRRAFAVLQRVDPGRAKRVRAVLAYAGLWPAGASEPPVASNQPVKLRPGDVVDVRAADHLDGLRPVRLTVAEVGPDVPWQSWIIVMGPEISDDPERSGTLVMVRPYKDALVRPGVLTRHEPRHEQGCPARPPVDPDPGSEGA